jgi:hypothetical protein
VSKCKEFQFFGCALFPATYQVGKRAVEKVLVSINEDGIHVHSGERKPFRVIKLEEIAS